MPYRSRAGAPSLGFAPDREGSGGDFWRGTRNRTRTWLTIVSLALGACADDPEATPARSADPRQVNAAEAAQPDSVTGATERAQPGSSAQPGPEEEGIVDVEPPLAEAYTRMPEHLMGWVRTEAVGPVEEVRDTVAQQTLYFPRGARAWKPFVAYAYVLDRAGTRNYHLFVGTKQPVWLSWNGISIEVDGASTPLLISASDKRGHVSYAGVREWIDVPVDATTRHLLSQLAEGERVVVRLSGPSPREFAIEKDARERVRHLLRAFEEGTF